MKKYKNIIIIAIPILVLIMMNSFLLLYIHNLRKSVKEDLMYYLNNSEVINEKLGEIKSIKVKGIGFEKKYNQLDNSTYIKCEVSASDIDKKTIKVIFNSTVTGGIYAYEIDDSIIYENVKSKTPFIDVMMESKILKELLGEFMYIYRPTNASYKKYKDTNYWACDYIIIINNEKSKQIKILVDENNSDFIYAYEIDGELIYENNEESIEKQ